MKTCARLTCFVVVTAVAIACAAPDPESATPPAARVRIATFELSAADPDVSVTVTYRWDDRQPVLRKFVSITNRGGANWNRLLNIRLGTYRPDARTDDQDLDFPLYLTESHLGGPLVAVKDTAGSKRGFPAYVEWQFFLGLAHPAGFATRQGGEVSLRQLPGLKLATGVRFECMEVVYGVSVAGAARPAFRDHLLGRMRRVRRAHDQPLAIFEPFGSKPDGGFWETEEFVLNNLAKVAEGRQQSGLNWDYYSLEFWHDPAGDLSAPSPKRFPSGFTNFIAELKRLRMKPGLWLDSGELGGWSIAANPAVKGALTHRGESLCRATEPANRFYIEGFTHQVRDNGVRLLKFDNFLDRCDEPAHEHLPGDYSTQPICNAVIECYRALDTVCPDVFLMLYWKYQSPWWLQHADTIFDAVSLAAGTRADGRLHHLAQDPTRVLPQRAVHPRQSMETRALRLLWQRRPARVHRRQQWRVAGEHVHARVELRLGSAGPTGMEPVSLVTKTVSDVTWTLLEPAEFRSAGGATLRKLADGSLLASGDNPSPDTYSIKASTGLTPITFIRLEALPDDSLPRKGPGRAVNGNFTVTEFNVSAAPADQPDAARLVRLRRAEADFDQAGHGGWPVAAALAVSVELRSGAHPYWTQECRRGLEFAGELGGKPATFQAVVNNGWYPASLQTWKVAVQPSDQPQPFVLEVTSALPPEVEHRFSAHFVPE